MDLMKKLSAKSNFQKKKNQSFESPIYKTYNKVSFCGPPFLGCTLNSQR